MRVTFEISFSFSEVNEFPDDVPLKKFLKTKLLELFKIKSRCEVDGVNSQNPSSLQEVRQSVDITVLLFVYWWTDKSTQLFMLTIPTYPVEMIISIQTSVLDHLQVGANDEGADICGYLEMMKGTNCWEQFWFVLKGDILHSYRACEVTVPYT